MFKKVCILAILLAVSPLVYSKHIRTTDKDSICNTKTSTIRNVSYSLKREVYKRDGVAGGNHTGICSGIRGCEVDHIVSLELGGSNNITNLMIQPYAGTCNADQKDKLENKLHDMICEGSIKPEAAQELIYNHWEEGYKLYIDPKGCR